MLLKQAQGRPIRQLWRNHRPVLCLAMGAARFFEAFFQNPMQWGSQAMDIALWQRGLFVLLSHALGVYRSDLLSQCYLRPEQYTWEFFQSFQLCVRSHFCGATFEATLLCWFYNWNPRLQRTYKTAQVQPACTFTTCNWRKSIMVAFEDGDVPPRDTHRFHACAFEAMPSCS